MQSRVDTYAYADSDANSDALKKANSEGNREDFKSPSRKNGSNEAVVCVNIRGSTKSFLSFLLLGH